MLSNKKTYTMPEIPGKILWKPTKEAETLSFEGNSFFPVREALLSVFKDFPFELTANELPLIKAMEAAAGVGKKPYSQIIEAIERHGSILISLDSAS